MLNLPADRQDALLEMAAAQHWTPDQLAEHRLTAAEEAADQAAEEAIAAAQADRDDLRRDMGGVIGELLDDMVANVEQVHQPRETATTCWQGKTDPRV